MNDVRLQGIGAWAALVVAILAPLQVALAIAFVRDANPLSDPVVQFVGTARVGVLVVVVLGLNAYFRALHPSAARVVLPVGLVGAGGAFALDLGALAGLPLGALDTVGALITGVLVGIWFFGAGAILMASGGGLERVGWPAQLGGLATIAASLVIALGLPAGTGTAVDWFLLLSLFVVVYLVRIWRYLIGGRLPSSGVL